jgi:hypothetical protein
MAVNLKEETILNEWSTVVLQGAGNASAVLNGIQQRLQASQIPGNCTWSIEECKSGGFLFKTKRELLIVDLEQFKDYHIYVGIRDYGTHLDCCRFLTIEPGFLKKMVSTGIAKDENFLSAPKNILVHQDLRAWVTVVHHAVLDSVDDILNKLGQDPKLMQRGSKGMLEIW